MSLMSRLQFLVFVAALMAAPLAVHAGGKSIAAMRQEAAAWLRGEAAQAYPDAMARVDIGKVDSRLHLGSCDAFHFFLPAGARLWSSGSLGVKCTTPARWTLYLTYQVQLTGPALTAQYPLPAHHLLSEADLSLGNVRYEQDPGAYLRAIPFRAATQRPMNAGQAILVYDLLLPDVIQAGSKVRVRVNGQGFSVAQEGKALNAAKAGGSVQVKMPSGRIVRGTATAAGEVEIRP
jgi:flagella basal body P-ring formation protein FlgA